MDVDRSIEPDVTGTETQSPLDHAKALARERFGSLVSGAAERINERAGAVREVGRDLRDRGQPTVAALADKAATQMERAAEYMRTADGARIAADLKELARKQPAAVAAAGFLIGLAAARIIKAAAGRDHGMSDTETPF
jgi:hypothetical protein